jgi:hypothetical protein
VLPQRERLHALTGISLNRKASLLFLFVLGERWVILYQSIRKLLTQIELDSKLKCQEKKKVCQKSESSIIERIKSPN